MMCVGARLGLVMAMCLHAHLVSVMVLQLVPWLLVEVVCAATTTMKVAAMGELYRMRGD